MSNLRSAVPLSWFVACSKALFRVQQSNCLQNDAAYDLQALRAKFVYRILRCVPEDVVVAVGEVDKVGGGHASLHEGKMIVEYRVATREEMGLVAKPRGCFMDDVFEPRG